jgi:hypothetical protein
MGLTLIQMPTVWDGSDVATLRTGFANSDEAAVVGGHVVAGPIVRTNEMDYRYENVECQMTRTECVAPVEGRLSGRGS